MLTFVTADPGRKRSAKFRSQQLTRIQSHCANAGRVVRRRSQPLHKKAHVVNHTCSSSHPDTKSIKHQNLQIVRSNSGERKVHELPASIQLCLGFEDVHGSDFLAGRSLQFFRERTAVEWSGWNDKPFWNEFALRLSISQPSIRHALISIAALHEAAEMSDPDQKRAYESFATKEAYRALSCLNETYAKLSVCVILAVYITIGTCVLTAGDLRMFKFKHLQLELFDHITRQPECASPSEWISITRYLEPVIERVRAKCGRYVDPVFCLRNTPRAQFFTEGIPDVPSTFVSTQQARGTLEDILNWTVYTTRLGISPTAKTLSQADILLSKYLRELNLHLVSSSPVTERDRCNITLLAISAKLSFMMIQSLFIEDDDELFYDNYVLLYAELLQCFRQVLAYNKVKMRTNAGRSTIHPQPANVGFGTDSGIITLAGQAACRWCRDPSMRREFISLLYSAPFREGGEAARSWALVAEKVMLLEERGLKRPMSCHDIPLQNRARINLARFWIDDPLQRSFNHVQCLLYPFGPEDVHDMYTTHGDFIMYPFAREINGLSNRLPKLVFGKGFTSVLDMTRPDKYITIKDTKFRFIVPSV